MVNKNKVKGSTWERDLVDLLNKGVVGGKFKRIPASGAMGTSLGESLLTGDVTGKIDGIKKSFKIECKVGYGGATQMTIKKEWLDKIREEAYNNLSYPILAAKFSGARGGTKHIIILDLDTFIDLINLVDNEE